jgi:hypothetical protein
MPAPHCTHPAIRFRPVICRLRRGARQWTATSHALACAAGVGPARSSSSRHRRHRSSTALRPTRAVAQRRRVIVTDRVTELSGQYRRGGRTRRTGRSGDRLRDNTSSRRSPVRQPGLDAARRNHAGACRSDTSRSASGRPRRRGKTSRSSFSRTLSRRDKRSPATSSCWTMGRGR